MERGYWTDNGAHDPTWSKGGIVRLLAFLRGETVEEALQYLRMKYGGPEIALYDDEITLDMTQLVAEKAVRKPLDTAVLEPYRYRHPYLSGRGVSDVIQRLCGIGYDRQSGAITLPVFNPDGTLANIKYRKVRDKVFWYQRGGRPVRECLFGIDIVYRRRAKRVAVTEAEVCAMTLMTAGMPAIATMGAAFTREKADLIRRSPIEELVLWRDQDRAGRKWQRDIIEELRGDVKISIVTVCGGAKDPNEAGVENVKRYAKRERRIKRITFAL